MNFDIWDPGLKVHHSPTAHSEKYKNLWIYSERSLDGRFDTEPGWLVYIIYVINVYAPVFYCPPKDLSRYKDIISKRKDAVMSWSYNYLWKEMEKEKDSSVLSDFLVVYIIITWTFLGARGFIYYQIMHIKYIDIKF